MIRKHAQRLKHYIETLETQAQMIRPKTVEVAMRWLEGIIIGLTEPAAPIQRPWPDPLDPQSPPWQPYAPQPPHIMPDVTMYGIYPVPYEPSDKITPYPWDHNQMKDWNVKITSTGNTDSDR
jgi:hypothetical protein